MTAIDPSQSLSLKEQAYVSVKKMILDETVPVNGFLSERNLAAQLGMSKTPVRLAIARLEHEGFVRVSPQQGIVVVALSFEQILDFIEYRLALESHVVKNLCSSLRSDQMHLLEQHLARQQSLNQSQREAQVYADMGFHALLAKQNGNQQIIEALLRQQAMLYRVAMRVFAKYPQRAAASLEEHHLLLAAIGEGRKKVALEMIERHILHIKTLLMGD
jgi:DNA-binding GntR family transcriptional regulator